MCIRDRVANLKEMAQVGKNHIASLRENAVATYKKLMGDKADETMSSCRQSSVQQQKFQGCKPSYEHCLL